MIFWCVRVYITINFNISLAKINREILDQDQDTAVAAWPYCVKKDFYLCLLCRIFVVKLGASIFYAVHIFIVDNVARYVKSIYYAENYFFVFLCHEFKRKLLLIIRTNPISAKKFLTFDSLVSYWAECLHIYGSFFKVLQSEFAVLYECMYLENCWIIWARYEERISILIQPYRYRVDKHIKVLS